jgi:List-Bact-rpt repeat protein
MTLTLRGLLLLGLVATALLAGGALPASAGAAKCLTCEGEGEGEVEAQFLTIEIVGHGSVKNGTKTYCENASSSSKECEVELAEGKKVTLTATPLGEYVFQGWSGACSGSGSCEVTMSEAKSVTATFTNPPPAPPTINSPTSGEVFERTAEQPVSVSFTNSGDAVRFRCSVDNPSGGEICFTPWSTPKLAAGTHTVRVWAEDAVGNLSTPASRSFEVVIKPPSGEGEGPPEISHMPSDAPVVVTAPSDIRPTQIHVNAVFKSRRVGKATIFRKLALKGLPAGTKAVSLCKGKGCPFKRKTVPGKNGVADFSAFFANRKLAPGVTITLKAGGAGMESQTIEIETRAGKAPKMFTS